MIPLIYRILFWEAKYLTNGRSYLLKGETETGKCQELLNTYGNDLKYIYRYSQTPTGEPWVILYYKEQNHD